MLPANKNIHDLYNDPAKLVIIEFANRTDIPRLIWVEPSCISIEIDANTEYQIVTHDKTFRMEFDKEETLVFYLQYSFGFKLFKRPTSVKAINPNVWILDMDTSEIN
jgi:hypothetical protein